MKKIIAQARKTALSNPCLLAVETLHNRFTILLPDRTSVKLTANTGWE